MLKNSSIVFVFIFLSFCSDQNENSIKQEFSVLDDLGRKVVFDKTPERIISLAPNLTEMIYLLNMGDKLIGNTTFCNYPSEADSVVKVGDLISYNYEKIVSLDPNLIILTIEGNTKQGFDKLIGLGFKVFVSNPRNFEGIKKSLADLAEIFQKDSIADRIIGEWNADVDSIRILTVKEKPRSAMFMIELHPLMVAGENTFINEYLKLCGLSNIAADSPVNYPVFNREEVVKRNPDIIIYPDDGSSNIQTLLKSYPEWANLKAFKNNMIIFADRDIYFRPGPRFVIALKDFYNKVFNRVKN